MIICGEEADAATFITDENGEITVKGLPPGTYLIYETKAADGYDLTKQAGYDDTKGWVECNPVVISKDRSTPTTLTVYNGEKGGLELTKVDSIYTDLKLSGAKFKFKLVSDNPAGVTGWLKNIPESERGNLSDSDMVDSNNAGVFETNSSGKITLNAIPYGTYEVYEVEAPKGYNITLQTDYDSTNKWVKCGTVSVTEENRGEITVKNKKKVIKLTGFVWIDQMAIGKEGISGDGYDFLYGGGDKRLSGVNVELCVFDNAGNMKTIATGQTTNSNGEYTFTKWSSNATATKVDPDSDDLYYWDLVNAFVKFTYNDSEYSCVNAFVGGSSQVAVNSKAILDDSINATATIYDTCKNLTPKQIADRTYQNTSLEQCGLTAYYDPSDYTIKYINLGLCKPVAPTVDSKQTLQYAKLRMRGYTYTYDYDDGNKGLLNNDPSIPGAYYQSGMATYGATVYPSDIAYTSNGGSKGIEMYVVYKIDVTNTTTTFIKDVYEEIDLRLNWLKDTFDSGRFELCTDKTDRSNWKGKDYFDIWSGGGGTANYNLDKEAGASISGDKLSSGIGPGATKSVYIQFQVKQTFLNSMLNGDASAIAAQTSKVASSASAEGYHRYWKKVKVKDKWISGYTDSKGVYHSGYWTYKDERQIKTTDPESVNCGALALVIKIGKDRSISGTVFEDFELESYDPNSEEIQEALGNGIKDDREGNKGKGVKVELIDVTDNSTGTVATIYNKLSGSYGPQRAEVITGSDGRYEFVGITPGLYYLRFTYGDNGTTKTKIVDTNGNEVDLNANDYKSTIISTTGPVGNRIKDAMETSYATAQQRVAQFQGASISSPTSADATSIKWYYFFGSTNYNIATDNLKDGDYKRNDIGNYVYSESEENAFESVVTYASRNVKDSFGLVQSKSPYFGITIENRTGAYSQMQEVNDNITQQPNHPGFNFGVIKVPQSNVVIDKIIASIRLINTQGASLSQDDPRNPTEYVTALDKLDVGSKYSKVEMDPQNIFGSQLETTYQITITNLSEADYLEVNSPGNYGNYFKYGDKSHAVLKQLTIKDVQDRIDKDYDIEDTKLDEEVYHPAGSRQNDNQTVKNTEKVVQTATVKDNDPSIGVNYLDFTEWSPIEAGGKQTIKYIVKGIFQENMDLQYDNEVRIVKFQLDEGSTLQSNYEWKRTSSTTVVITPDTGENRDPIYFIVGAIALVVLGTGIIIIKKKIIK